MEIQWKIEEIARKGAGLLSRNPQETDAGAGEFNQLSSDPDHPIPLDRNSV